MVSLRTEEVIFRTLLNGIFFSICNGVINFTIGLRRNYWVKTPFITISKRNERFESRGTSKSYYMFALTLDLPQRSHITWNLSVTTHLSRRFFVLDDIYLLSFLFDDFSFNISSVSDPFIFRLTWRRDLFLVENAYVFGWWLEKNLRKKDCENV